MTMMAQLAGSVVGSRTMVSADHPVADRRAAGGNLFPVPQPQLIARSESKPI